MQVGITGSEHQRIKVQQLSQYLRLCEVNSVSCSGNIIPHTNLRSWHNSHTYNVHIIIYYLILLTRARIVSFSIKQPYNLYTASNSL